MGTSKFNAGANPVMDWHPTQGGVEIRFTPHKLELSTDLMGHLGPNADFTLPGQANFESCLPKGQAVTF